MMLHRRIVWIVLICMGIAMGTLQAAIPVIRNGPLQHLGHELEWTRDPDGNLGIDDRADLQWVQSNIAKGDYPAIGYTPDAVWARVSLANPDDQALDVVMELTRARLSKLTWFVLDGDQVLQTVSHGLDRDYAGVSVECVDAAQSAILAIGGSGWQFLGVLPDLSRILRVEGRARTDVG